VSTAIVSTDPVFGPWIIPSRAQNMIMNQYSQSRGINVDAVIPEPLFSKQLLTTRWSKESKNLSSIILCSIHQLPQDKSVIDSFLDDMHNVEVHFVLENLCGIGRKFLLEKIYESSVFLKSKVIPYRKTDSYKTLYYMMQNNK